MGRRDDYGDEEDRPRRRRGGFSCPYCGETGPPARRTKISGGGWVMFCVLLLFCFPVCWIPLLVMRDEYRVCYACGVQLG